MLCGVWYGSDDPNMHTFLRPLVDFMNDFYTNGVCSYLYTFTFN